MKSKQTSNKKVIFYVIVGLIILPLSVQMLFPKASAFQKGIVKEEFKNTNFLDSENTTGNWNTVSQTATLSQEDEPYYSVIESDYMNNSIVFYLVSDNGDKKGVLKSYNSMGLKKWQKDFEMGEVIGTPKIVVDKDANITIIWKELFENNHVSYNYLVNKFDMNGKVMFAEPKLLMNAPIRSFFGDLVVNNKNDYYLFWGENNVLKYKKYDSNFFEVYKTKQLDYISFVEKVLVNSKSEIYIINSNDIFKYTDQGYLVEKRTIFNESPKEVKASIDRDDNIVILYEKYDDRCLEDELICLDVDMYLTKYTSKLSLLQSPVNIYKNSSYQEGVLLDNMTIRENDIFFTIKKYNIEKGYEKHYLQKINSDNSMFYKDIVLLNEGNINFQGPSLVSAIEDGNYEDLTMEGDFYASVVFSPDKIYTFSKNYDSGNVRLALRAFNNNGSSVWGKEVVVNPLRYVKNSVIQTTDIIPPSTQVKAFKVTSSDSRPARTYIKYYVSTDNGSNWYPVTLGRVSDLKSPINSIRLKAELSTMDQNVTPVIKNISVEYTALDQNEKDYDGDGLVDALEILKGTDPYNPDTDGDTITDYMELEAFHTNPFSIDTDGDGYTDDVEIKSGYSPTIPSHIELTSDEDKDGLVLHEERMYSTNPKDADTDGDKFSDYDEVMIYHTDPGNPDSQPAK